MIGTFFARWIIAHLSAIPANLRRTIKMLSPYEAALGSCPPVFAGTVPRGTAVFALLPFSPGAQQIQSTLKETSP